MPESFDKPHGDTGGDDQDNSQRQAGHAGIFDGGLELLVDDPADRTRLNGSGLLVINPPWTLAADAEAMLPAMAERLARGGYGAYLCESLTPRT